MTSSSATLTWAAASDATGVTGYDIVRVSGGTESAVTSSTRTTATLTGLSPATSHTFAVYARDAAGNRSPRSGTVTVTTSSGGSSSACGVGYRVTGSWSGGFQGEVVLRNTGTSAINGWTLRWTFPDSQRITNLWGGTATQSGSEVSVAAASYGDDPGVGLGHPRLHGLPVDREPQPDRLHPERRGLHGELSGP